MPSNMAFAGSIPAHYETYLGPIFFEPYALDLVERIKGDKLSSVVELACGTGRVTKHLLKKIDVAGHVQATDLNPDMLRVAKEAVPDNRVVWQVADAHDLPFDENFAAALVCQFGVMFFADKPKAFAEAFRVLRPGGYFYFNTWNSLSHNALANLANEVLQDVFPEQPNDFFEKGPYSFYHPAVVQGLLADAGFVQIRIEKEAKLSSAPSPNEAVKGILDGTPISLYLQERGTQADKARRRLHQQLVEQFGETNLAMPMEAFVCTAMKPE